MSRDDKCKCKQGGLGLAGVLVCARGKPRSLQQSRAWSHLAQPQRRVEFAHGGHQLFQPGPPLRPVATQLRGVVVVDEVLHAGPGLCQGLVHAVEHKRVREQVADKLVERVLPLQRGEGEGDGGRARRARGSAVCASQRARVPRHVRARMDRMAARAQVRIEPAGDPTACAPTSTRGCVKQAEASSGRAQA